MGKERLKRDEIKAELEALKKERDDLSAEFERLKGKVDAATDASKSAKGQLKFRTTQEIDAEIARLEREQSTTSMTLAAEKKLIKDLGLLRGQKQQLAALGQNADQMKSDKEERARIGAALKAKRDEITACLTRLNAQRDAIEKLANKDGGPKSKIPGLIEERKALSEKKKEAVGRIREILQEIKECVVVVVSCVVAVHGCLAGAGNGSNETGRARPRRSFLTRFLTHVHPPTPHIITASGKSSRRRRRSGRRGWTRSARSGTRSARPARRSTSASCKSVWL